jgi:hypothetical protein
MEERIYETSPSYGFIKKDYKRFNDKSQFNGRSYLFAGISKIKIWYGTPVKSPDNDNKNDKAILGIECWYKSMGQKIKDSVRHIGTIQSSDVVTKELELKENEFLSKCYISYDSIIRYIKFVSNKGTPIELGNSTNQQSLSINEREKAHIIQYLFGFYDDCGLRALGFRHAPRIKMIIMNNIGILRLRHLIKTDAKQKEYWSKEENLQKLDEPMRAIAKLAYLPDYPFSIIYQFFL